MISKPKIADALDDINTELNRCWEIISSASEVGKKRRRDIGANLINLQNDLVRVLAKLDHQYRAVVQEKKRLVANKKKYNPKWFSMRMANLDHCRKVILQTIGTAKTIGDGYAWIFYRNADDLIEEHAKSQRQTLLPPGVGGIGERAFVEKAQGFAGHFVLYHGITSFLRLGDISLIDLETGTVKTICELKTKRVEKDKYNITIGYVSGGEIDPLNMDEWIKNSGVQRSSKSEAAGSKLSGKVHQSLKRQMKQLATTFAKEPEEPFRSQHKKIGDYYFDHLGELVERTKPNQFQTEKLGAGLLVIALRLSERRQQELRYKERDKDWAKKKLAGLEKDAVEIFSPDLKDNCLFLGNLIFDDTGFPLFRPGALPVAWWPIKKDVLKDIVFGNINLYTAYNPAHFWKLLRDRGFEVEIGARSEFVRASRKFGSKVMEFRNFDYFKFLAQCHLMSEETIMSVLDLTISQVEMAGADANVEFTIKPVVKI